MKHDGTKAWAMVGRRQFVGSLGISVLGLGQASGALARPARQAGRFQFASPDVPEGFLLDGKPHQLRSGEMHPARIPREHWLHRIRMAKAMGLNAIAIYVMWNYHEPEPGAFDFTTGNRDIAAFVRLCAAEGMLVYLRPGPYVCAEWDLGGLPAWLLRTPGIKLRHGEDRTYMAACERYIARLAAIVRPLMCDRGGPIVMVQVENEYASFGNDLAYLLALRKMWTDHGIAGPFAIAEGLDQVQQEHTYVPGAALGINGSTDFADARKVAPEAPIWVGEGYPGWLTHWGEPKFATGDYRDTMRMLMRERRSFNLYVVHGGTNFGFTAGANSDNDGSKFQPSITSYDYGAPINECGVATAQYHALRQIIADATGAASPSVPAAPARIAFPAVGTRPQGSLWAALPKPVLVETPEPMELVLGQTQGMVLYSHQLAAGQGGTLRIDGLHDEALVLVDGQPIGSLSRLPVAKAPDTIALPPSGQARRLDILVYAYGRVNYGRYMEDRKGILGRITLDGQPLTRWSVFGLPLDDAHLARVRAAPSTAGGLVHEAEVTLDRVGDTFIDMKGWKLGFVWVNGHLLGRHCALGPQTRLYCPAGWLKRGRNRVTVLDLYAGPGLTVRGTTLSDSMEEARLT